MAVALDELEVLALDCQAGGATPAHGDLLEIGWARCGRDGLRGPIHQHFVLPRTERRIPAAVRELTGWSEACLATAWSEQTVWSALRADVDAVAAQQVELARAPAVIHFARFELTFLHDLHARLDNSQGGSAETFPIDAICLHAIAARLFPELPRRNIRALAGYLGHSPELMRRCAGHVEATAFIWRALLPRLAREGVTGTSELAAWLERAAPARSSARRSYPFAAEQRRALPDCPGVYRFLRSNGDVLYVGKAASLKKRVASHFAGQRRRGAAMTERALELLTQVQDVQVTTTPSVLEAALLECDEIKRLDPPYNVQLRSGERQAWFASRDLADAASTPDAQHVLGPLPSRRALAPLWALVALADGAQPRLALQACALQVPGAYLPDSELFQAGWSAFEAAHLPRPTAATDTQRRVLHASRALWQLRGRAETDAGEELPPDGWDLARVLRRLERSLIQGGLLARRARWLGLLAHADVALRERAMHAARALVIELGAVVECRDLGSVNELAALPTRPAPARAERQRCFDALRYDRMRVLATELNRVHAEGGEIAIRIGSRAVGGARLARVLRWV